MPGPRAVAKMGSSELPGAAPQPLLCGLLLIKMMREGLWALGLRARCAARCDSRWQGSGPGAGLPRGLYPHLWTRAARAPGSRASRWGGAR